MFGDSRIGLAPVEHQVQAYGQTVEVSFQDAGRGGFPVNPQQPQASRVTYGSQSPNFEPNGVGRDADRYLGGKDRADNRRHVANRFTRWGLRVMFGNPKQGLGLVVTHRLEKAGTGVPGLEFSNRWGHAQLTLVEPNRLTETWRSKEGASSRMRLDRLAMTGSLVTSETARVNVSRLLVRHRPSAPPKSCDELSVQFRVF
jgi:hypothetical protein